MKKYKLHLLVLIMSAFVAACSSGGSPSSNDSNNLEDVRVQSVFPPNGTIYINPADGLQPDTTYSYSIDLPATQTQQNQQTVLNPTYTVSTQPVYKIFLT